MKKLILLLATLAIFTTSCDIDTRHRKHEYKHKHAVVHSYKDANDVTNALDDVFFYVISEGDINYYTTSTTPLKSFSGVQWTKTDKPIEELKEADIEKLPEEQIEVDELPADMQEAVADNPGGFEDSPADAADAASADAAADGGSGGDGGGDGGGGDGGGGGD